MTDMVLPDDRIATGEDLHGSRRSLRTWSRPDTQRGIRREEPRSHIFFLAKPYCGETLLEKSQEILEAKPHARTATQAG